MLDFTRIATVSPSLRVGDCGYNASQMKPLVTKARLAGAHVVLFPELGITGYSCADLFRQPVLLRAAEAAVADLLAWTADWDGVMVFGCPVPVGGNLFNCALVAQSGKLMGIVPKTHLPGNNEFYEPRWFTPGADAVPGTQCFAGQEAAFGTDLLFPVTGHPDLVIGIEICEDLWAPVPPSSLLARAGATVILNPSASNEQIGKAEYRRELVANQSARGLCVYAYASANPCESTTDTVFGGHMLIAEGGRILSENARFDTEGSLLLVDVDTQRMQHDRRNAGSFHQRLPWESALPVWRRVALTRPQLPVANAGETNAVAGLMRPIDRHPFVPGNPAQREERCREILAIQTAALAKRMTHTGIKKLVVAVSGGLDSTLALIVAVRTMDRLGLPRENVLGITMPGFGTTDRTYQNALDLMRHLGAATREIPIAEAALLHFRDIGHDPAVHDVTYENVQARERTQIAMDIANQVGGLLVGTGDLSEMALGWCTYNGDHMSMYAVNAGVPKTLVKYVVGWYADHEAAEEAAAVLRDILATPISPELLPPDPEGKIAQKTEEVVGPYELHDFFLYHVVRYGAGPAKVLGMARLAFAGDREPEEIEKWLRVFIKRFFSQQFKRSCVPDGPKVGSISLSPRADWRMPSDASAAAWLRALDVATGKGNDAE
jgi:NAD+ synthase (glutamine-hydrolysing)